MKCEYGCGQEAKHQFKNGKWCCSSNIAKCPTKKKKMSKRMTGKLVGKDNPFFGKKHTKETRKRISKNRKGKLSGKDHPLFGQHRSDKTKEKIGKANKGNRHTPESKRKISETLRGRHLSASTKKKISKASRKQKGVLKNFKKFKKLYPFLCQIEEIKEDKETGKIMARCKNHNCQNSKEQDGWFFPTYSQLYERHRALSSPYGFEENNMYCSDECKASCILYKTRNDPNTKKEKPYTEAEYQTFRNHVLERDNHTCQYCGEPATSVHHERPQKLEPFFSLDPDYAWSCCEKCHYKKGHKDECSTGNIAGIMCI